MRARRPGFLVAAFIGVSVLGAQSSGTVLRARFWTDLNLPPRAGEAYPLPDKVAASRVLDEAAWVFSGMIEGFSFDWTPENKSRQVKESFVLTPLSSIVAGDPRLQPGRTEKNATSLGAWIDFSPDPADSQFLESTSSPSWKNAQGRAAVLRSRGWEGRREAYVQAARAALEAWARTVEPARPREIKGLLVFATAPLVAVEEDSWVVTARVRIDPIEIRRWALF